MYIMLRRCALAAAVCIILAANLVHAVPLRSPVHGNSHASSGELTIPALFLKAMFGIQNINPGSSAGGGTACAVCSPVVGLLVELADVNNVTVTELMDDICTYFPAPINAYCDSVVKKFGPDVLHYLDEKLSPDEVCYKLSLCTNAQCRLWPAKATRPLASIVQLPLRQVAPATGETPWQWLLDQINRVANSHEPLVDLDHDLHSTEMTLRGGNWRGRDCNDFDSSIRPGRAESGKHAMVDENCNGISGINKDSGNGWEMELCNGTDAKGIAVLGDSAGAHFHIPVTWLDPHAINKTTYSELVFVLANEMDWPQRSATSGFVAADRDDPGNLSSLYAAMRDRNRCNHRDYHNIAVNGARASDMNSTIIRSFQRSQELDKPVLVSFALIGNDVCDGHPDYWNRMTKPEDFHNSVVASLEYLDTVLPMGSHVMMVGVAHGSVLYDTMHNRTHPIGTQYENMYDWLNCLEMSPCLVWMNSNETIRNAGDTRAAELNAQSAIPSHLFF
jgi:acyloxyacyl hydrolase